MDERFHGEHGWLTAECARLRRENGLLRELLVIAIGMMKMKTNADSAGAPTG